MAAPIAARAAAAAASSKGGRKLIMGALVAMLALPVGLVMGGAMVITMLMSGGSPAAGGGGACLPQLSAIAKVEALVPKYNAEQLTNAAAIMQAASQLTLPRAAQVLGVQTAIQESTLRVLGYGDAVGPDSRGLFQQRDNWGPLSVRMDPVGSSLLFFEALKKLQGWESMAPEQAIHLVQINERASDYVPRRADAEKIVDAWASVSCTGNIPGDARAAAQQLVAAEQAGTVKYADARMWNQIVAYTTPAGPSQTCQVDVRVMQIILLAAQWYGEVGFSDLGRVCVNDCSYGAGSSSLHCQSPDLAVDLTNLGGQGLSGWDAKSVDFVRRLATVLPEGAGIGQSTCRADHGVSVDTPGIRQFKDSCDHLHIELGWTQAPLNVAPSTGG